jgi:hypothetical protein
MGLFAAWIFTLDGKLPCFEKPKQGSWLKGKWPTTVKRP